MEIKNNNLDIAKKYLEIAEKDLGASKVLYDNGNYFLSIYHLQQSTEKLMKYYFLKMGMKQERLKHYLGHEPIDEHVMKGILLLFNGYTFRNIIMGVGAIRISTIFPILAPILDPILEKLFLSTAAKNQKLIYESLEEFMNLDKSARLKMKKEDILRYAFGLTNFFSNRNLPKYSGPYVKMLDIVDEMAENEKIGKDIDRYFSEVYGTTWSEYLEDCYSEIQKSYRGSLEPKFKKQLNEGNIDNDLKNEIKTKTGGTISDTARVSKIDERHWEIQDNNNVCRIRDAGKRLHTYKKLKGENADIKIAFKDMIKNVKQQFSNRNTCLITIIILSMITGPHESCTRYPKSEILEPSDYKPNLGIVDAYLDIHEALKYCINDIKSHSLQ
ncbi:MAG: hypothetical protein CVT89_00210 [Candidatus Altiarchaeales archaeon HGW-Altiarchaeales-2]|nr:MAG: hypothetical protein CVT89_00210 [Candidatus Altiarchaeales archaeon HGW-Altiarchaeales-2]